MTKMVRGTMMTALMKGTNRALKISGMCLFSQRSRQLSTSTRNSGGSTLEV